MPFLGQQMRGERGRSQGLHQSVCVRVDACEENGEGRQEEEGKGGREKEGRETDPHLLLGGKETCPWVGPGLSYKPAKVIVPPTSADPLYTDSEATPRGLLG